MSITTEKIEFSGKNFEKSVLETDGIRYTVYISNPSDDAPSDAPTFKYVELKAADFPATKETVILALLDMLTISTSKGNVVHDVKYPTDAEWSASYWVYCPYRHDSDIINT